VAFEKVIDFVSFLRNTIENISFTEKHLSNKDNKLILKSSLYVLEDTWLILNLYIKDEIIIKNQSNWLDEKAKNYLLIYGILQTLYIQQDAIINICSSINIFSKKIVLDNSELVYIRNIRNSGIGHPSNTLKDKSTNFISQMSVNQYHFSFLKVTENKTELIEVKIKDLIKMQEKNINDVLDKITFRIQEMICGCNFS